MSETVSDFVVARLAEWDVKRVYSYPGDGINGLVGAFSRDDHQIDYVQVRHEESAGFMACAEAKFTGRAGVCMATSGPGAIHLLNGLYDAKLDHQPVVAIVGQAARTAMGGSYQQEVDLMSLYKDVAGAFVQTAMVPAQVRHLIDRAFRTAYSERTVTCVIFPNDLQEVEAVPSPPHAHSTVHSSSGYHRPQTIPTIPDLERAAQILNAGEKVAMLIGQGAMHARSEVIDVAEKLGAGVAKALLGKAALSDELPFVTGSIGLLGTRPSWEMMRDCDTLLMVGTSFPYSEYLPEEGQARAVQIDIDGRMLGLRYPTEVNLVGDSAATLGGLSLLLEPKVDRKWRKQIESNVTDWKSQIERMAMDSADPINPQRVFHELSPRLPKDCILTSDAGSGATWFARNLMIGDDMLASLSGTLATMGSGVPYAIAAKFCYPERTAIAMVGDGVMQMNGMNELMTVSKYWRSWANPRLIVLVLHNGDLNMVTWEQRTLAGDPRFVPSQELPNVPYAEYAELLGLRGIVVDDPDQLGLVWDQALAADRPTVIDAIVDPTVPPLPPHITLDQAKAFTAALLKGDGGALKSMRHTIKAKAREVAPIVGH